MGSKMTFVKVIIALLILNIVRGIEDKKFWHDIADKEIKDALTYSMNTNTAKNVIIFVGDGMSPDTITASRIYADKESSYLAWERFPNVGLLKTYNIDRQSPDSASTATALFCGVKSNHHTHGVDANVAVDDCEASLRTENRVESIISWAQAAGKSTGFVTTTRVTHATPAPLYAHGPNRKWESDGTMPNATRCKDIARQLIEDEPGKSIKVIMGGGRQMLQRYVNVTEADPIDTWAGRRKDERNLVDEWIKDKEEKKVAYSVAQNTKELRNVNYTETEFLLGIFANGFLPMEYKRDTSENGQPSLEEMTVAAINVLKKSKEGYLLMVEGGLIDFAHHRGHAGQALLETVRMSEAVKAALSIVDTQDTLIIVTSDHTHSMAFNGQSPRGRNVLGLADRKKQDKVPFTILTYTTGGPDNMAYESINNTAERIDPSLNDTTEFTYSQQATVITDEARHGAGDVNVYAIGPYAHLFHTTHEQNFVAHVIAYASKIGPYHSSASSHWNMFYLGILLSLIVTKFANYGL